MEILNHASERLFSLGSAIADFTAVNLTAELCSGLTPKASASRASSSHRYHAVCSLLIFFWGIQGRIVSEERKGSVLMKMDKGGTAPTLTRVVCGFADIKVLDAKGRYHVQLPEVRSGHGGLPTINNDHTNDYHEYKH